MKIVKKSSISVPEKCRDQGQIAVISAFKDLFDPPGPLLNKRTRILNETGNIDPPHRIGVVVIKITVKMAFFPLPFTFPGDHHDRPGVKE